MLKLLEDVVRNSEPWPGYKLYALDGDLIFLEGSEEQSSEGILFHATCFNHASGLKQLNPQETSKLRSLEVGVKPDRKSALIQFNHQIERVLDKVKFDTSGSNYVRGLTMHYTCSQGTYYYDDRSPLNTKVEMAFQSEFITRPASLLEIYNNPKWWQSWKGEFERQMRNCLFDFTGEGKVFTRLIREDEYTPKENTALHIILEAAERVARTVNLEQSDLKKIRTSLKDCGCDGDTIDPMAGAGMQSKTGLTLEEFITNSQRDE